MSSTNRDQWCKLTPSRGLVDVSFLLLCSSVSKVFKSFKDNEWLPLRVDGKLLELLDIDMLSCSLRCEERYNADRNVERILPDLT